VSTSVLAAGDSGIEIGQHWTVTVGGFTLNLDTILATVVAGGVLVGLGLYMAHRASVGKPSGLQLFFETVKDAIETQVEENLGIKTAPWVVPFAFTIALLILFCNMLAILPTEEWLPPPTADVNLTYALALIVMFSVWFTAIKRHPGRFFGHFKNPMAIIEEITKPVSLALRLFGNILSGVIMIQLILLMPIYIFWAPFTAWKLFDIFIAVLQAVIFTILTIIYFGQAVGEESEAH